jgi:glycosyltransferase involved in cell wall biosynthesis
MSAQRDGCRVANVAGILQVTIREGLRIRAQRHADARTANRKLSGNNRASARQLCSLPRALLPRKNCDLLIEAFENIDTPMKLVLAGGSSHTDSYVSGLRQHQSERIRILDWISGDALEEVLTNAALFILPSDLEGLSLALLDAMGAGLCVLASDAPENVEAIGDAGFTFRRGDVNDLQRMLVLLLSDSVLREDVGRRAQARIRREYLWEEGAKEMNAVYASLFERPQQIAVVKKKAAEKAA